MNTMDIITDLLMLNDTEYKIDVRRNAYKRLYHFLAKLEHGTIKDISYEQITKEVVINALYIFMQYIDSKYSVWNKIEDIPELNLNGGMK